MENVFTNSIIRLFLFQKICSFYFMNLQKTKIYVIFLLCLGAFTSALNINAKEADKRSKVKQPNIIFIFADDLGYGDLGSFGNPKIKTPNLDRMAAEGVRLTNFYSSSPVCTPSRAGLLTGRYPIRSGMTRVFFPTSNDGLDAQEVTLADALRKQGYRTAAIGKWHLGHLPQFLPINHGFDYYFGIPYSNDMTPARLLRNTETIEEPVQQETLTARYTTETIKFIEQSKAAGKPFFVYLPHTFPHVPLFASDKFKDKSAGGLYGDTIEELDWSVGEILSALRNLNLDSNTLVIFTSDNGPWLAQKENGGSAGPLRDGKFSVYEGGIREPFVARFPGVISAGIVGNQPVIALDMFPTLLKLAGGNSSGGKRKLDGIDVMPILIGQAKPFERTFYFYRDETLQAVRRGKWKLHLPRQIKDGVVPTELYDLTVDEGETKNLAAENPSIVRELTLAAERFDREAKLTATPPKKNK